MIAGEGSELPRLAKVAGPRISFLGRVTDAEVADLLSRCRAFLLPGEEDFGITAVEAQAAGAPVIAYGKGGALETVVGVDCNGDATGVEYTRAAPGRRGGDAIQNALRPTGVFFHEPSPEGLMDAIEKSQGVHLWDHKGGRVLDGSSSLFNVAAGHGRVEIAEV